MNTLTSRLVARQVKQAKQIIVKNIAWCIHTRLMLLHHLRIGRPASEVEALMEQVWDELSLYNWDGRMYSMHPRPVLPEDVDIEGDHSRVSHLHLEGGHCAQLVMDSAQNAVGSVADYLNDLSPLTPLTLNVPNAFGKAYRLLMTKESFSNVIKEQYLSHRWIDVFAFKQPADAILLANINDFFKKWWGYNAHTFQTDAPNFMAWTPAEAWQFIAFFLTPNGFIDPVTVKHLHLRKYYITEADSYAARCHGGNVQT